MKTFLSIFILMLISCTPKNTPESEVTTGDLHNKTIAEWKAASDQNKLATCEDIAARLKEAEKQKYTAPIDIQADAIALKVCIDEGTINNQYADNMKVSEIATLCYILMKSPE